MKTTEQPSMLGVDIVDWPSPERAALLKHEQQCSQLEELARAREWQERRAEFNNRQWLDPDGELDEAHLREPEPRPITLISLARVAGLWAAVAVLAACGFILAQAARGVL